MGWVSGVIAMVAIGGGQNWLGKVEKWVDPVPTVCLTQYDRVVGKLSRWIRPFAERPLLYLLGKSKGLLQYATQEQLQQLHTEFQEIQQLTGSIVSEAEKPGKPVPETKESDWTITVQVLVKRSVGGTPALYFPHKVWFEPETKRLFWQASGDDLCLCDAVQTAKVLNKVAMTFQVTLATPDSTKVLKFKDATLFKTWTERFLSSLSQSS